MAGTVDNVFLHECGPDSHCMMVKLDGILHCVLNRRWCFWDEAYDVHGPFENEHEARLSSVEYCHLELDGGFR